MRFERPSSPRALDTSGSGEDLWAPEESRAELGSGIVDDSRKDPGGDLQ